MNSLKSFSYLSNSIRVIEIDGQQWFVVKDVASVLDISNTTMALKKLSDGEVRFTQIEVNHLVKTRKLRHSVVSESGLYKLIMRSDKPDARKFQDWVTREVLPAIRKDGGYLLNEEVRDTAKADDRQGILLPEEFALVLSRLTEVVEQQSQLLSMLLLGWRAGQSHSPHRRSPVDSCESKRADQLPPTLG